MSKCTQTGKIRSLSKVVTLVEMLFISSGSQLERNCKKPLLHSRFHRPF